MVVTSLTSAIIISLLFMIGLNIIYFSKQRATNEENSIYKIIIISNTIALILHILCDYISYNFEFLPEWYSTIFLKIYGLYFVEFGVLLLAYLIVISQKFKFKTTDIRNFCILFMILVAIIMFILPQEIYIDKENFIFYTCGKDIEFVYSMAGVLIITLITVLIFSFKNVSKKKTIPLYLFITGCAIATIFQKVNPMIVIMDCLESIICFLMYFTIENPDMKLIEQLNISRDQAEKANNAKTEFLSNMSHEIRTPLNAIVGFSQALLEEDLTSEAKEEVKDIIMASDNLLEIVNGILDISKIEANKLEIINTEYSLEPMVKELCLLTKARIGEKPIDFRVNIDQSIPGVLYGDHTRLKQIILNILTNAAKYTKEGFIEFKISSVIKDNICRLIISVEDSGIGIKEEKIDHLFEKFDRLGVEENITIEGTGLGLAITKKLIDLMNGKIVVQSVYGKGSKFTVAIDQKIIKTEKVEIKEDKKEVEFIDLKGKKILVVDDNKVNLKVAERLLKNYNVDIKTVDSGEECLTLIKNNETFDLILMDDMMPKMSGTETFHKLKEIDNFNIPVIALTANAISGMREKYLNEGFDDYLSKPIQKSELNQILNKYLK